MIENSVRRRCRYRSCAAAILTIAANAALADGIVVDRIYDPYVRPLETEIEWRSIYQVDDEARDLQRHSLGIGRSLSDRWSAELYAIGTRDRGDELTLDLYEFEFKRQITEQGEYAVDWGVVFELERQVDVDVTEASTVLLAARDFGRWTGIANFGVVYEWGSGVVDEIETELRAQARYRYRETLEPALEVHMGQNTAAVGPSLTGTYRAAPGKSLRWEAGVFFALDEKSPDQIFKVNLEYEF
jgi:hypothetical protein